MKSFRPSLIVPALLITALPAFATAPVLVHPASNGTEYVSLPYFDWADFVTSAPYPGSYEIQIDDAQGFNTPVASATVPALISYYSPHEELAQGTYYWRVRYRDAGGSPSDWSAVSQFSIAAPHVIDVAATDGWEEIKAKLEQALVYSASNPEFAELRFPAEETFELTQIYDPLDPSSEFLFYVQDRGRVIINGRGSTIVLTKAAASDTCGFFSARSAANMQLKDFTIDYTADSLSQFGGTVVAVDTVNQGFTVEVDPAVYQNEAEFAGASAGFFVNAEHRQRIGRQGVEYDMNETWQSARIGTSHQYHFTAQSLWNRYADELKVGDYFVSTDRGGDIVYLFTEVDDFVANGLTVNGTRGRYFIVRRGNSEFNRSIGNRFLRTQNRILGSPSGGVNDKGKASWHENVTIEYTRDDSFHASEDHWGNIENVLLNSSITGAFRNSVWLNSDRVWIEGNVIRHAGTDGIGLGGAGIDTEVGEDTQVTVGLIKNNTILSPRRSGIVSRPPLATSPEQKNRHIALIGNTVRDHQSDEAVLLEHLEESEVSGNKIESTGDSVWRVYSDPALQMGFHVALSDDVVGTGNEVTDPRIACLDRLVVETDATDIAIGLTGPSTGVHESWNCEVPTAFTAPGTLAADHSWSIQADNFRVEVVDDAILQSPGFGRLVSDVLPGKSATATDKHVTALPAVLSPGTDAVRIQARFVFAELTTSGRAEAKLGVEDAATGVFYGIGLTSKTDVSPITLYAVNANNSVTLGSAGDQDDSGAWFVDATFRRVSSTSTAVDYLVRRPNGAPYSGSSTLPIAVGATATFDQVFLAFRQRGQVVLDWIQVTAAD